MDKKELVKLVKSHLVIGKVYKINKKRLGSRKGQDNEFDWNKKIRKMRCIGIFSNHAVFKDARGMRESFVYADIYKLFWGTEEADV